MGTSWGKSVSHRHFSRPSISRRRFFQLGAGGAVAALGADSVLIEPDLPRVVRQEIALKRWPSRMDGFTIALLSDFHYDSIFSVHPIRRSVEIVNGLNPDLIALAGDFITAPAVGDPAQGASTAEPCAELLSHMKAPHGLWAALGNHDYADAARVAGALASRGIRVLDNRSVPIEKNGGRFWLSGIDDVLDGTPDLKTALKNIPTGEAIVLLAHEPDYADAVVSHPVDLQLSGHSHGGQVRFPFVPPLFMPELGKKYILGLYNIGELTLYTTAGIGTVRLPFRFDCPPEVTLLTLRQGAA